MQTRYAPDSKEELQFAVDMWREDSTSALMMFGTMDNWDVSLVTDMSFYSKAILLLIGILVIGMFWCQRNQYEWNVSNGVLLSLIKTYPFGMFQMLQVWEICLRALLVLIGYPVGMYPNVTNLYKTFLAATSFNQDLSSWDVSNVTDMYALFYGCGEFTSDLSRWNVTNVTSMHAMFSGASAFDSDISLWDVSSVTDMDLMFRYANSFTNVRRYFSGASVGCF